MTHYVSKIERLRVLDGESSFGTDGSGSLGSYLEVPFIAGTCTPDLDHPNETPGHAQQRVDGYPTRVLLPRKATLPFSVNFEVPTTKATSTVAATKGWLGALLHTALGGYHQMTGTTVNGAGATTTVIPASVATTLRPGAAIALVTSTGTIEMREIESKSGSDITLKLAVTGAPSAASTIYGSSTYFTDPRSTGASFRSLQFAFEGQNIEDRHLLRGCILNSLGMDFPVGGIPRFNFNWRAADWDQADGSATAGDLTGGVLGASTYINANTMVLADSEFRVQTVGTSTLSSTLIAASSFTYTPNITFADVTTVAGVNNILQGVRVHTAPVISGDFLIPYEDSQAWWDRRTNRTATAIWLQIGTAAATGGFLVSVPNAQITAVRREDVNGVIGQRVSWVARLDTDTTAESGHEGVAESAFKIHVF